MAWILILILQMFTMSCVPHATLDSFSGERFTDTLELIDARPEIQKESDRGNLWNPWDCGFGIKRIGDGQTKPDRLEYLKHIFLRDGGDLFAGKSLLVKDFSIYMNNQFSSRKSPGYTSSDQQAAHIALSSQNCWVNEKNPAYYSDEENPDQNPAYIVHVEIEKDEKNL